MAKESGWKKMITDRVSAYVDNRFVDYKSQISEDVSRGIANLAGLVVIWTLVIISLLFVGFTLALLFGYMLKSNLIGFGIVSAIILLIAVLVFVNKEKWIEQPVYESTTKALNGEIPTEQTKEELLAEVLEKIEKERAEEEIEE